MEPESSRLKTEIVHVLFTDMVAYSLLPTLKQAQVTAMLQEIIRSTNQYRRALVAENLLAVDTGDGVGLVFFREFTAPFHCAIEIAGVLRRHPEIQLRMGIHSGPVAHGMDINANKNVYGGGMNMAQRVMNCGEAGHILLSERIAHDIMDIEPEWSACLHPLGAAQVKHNVHISLYNFWCEKEGVLIGNPAIPKRDPKTEDADGSGKFDRAPVYHAVLEKPAGNERGVEAIVQALLEPPRDVAEKEVLETPWTGPVAPASSFYVKRSSDNEAIGLMTQRSEQTLVLQAPRQSGATSLLLRIEQAAIARGKRIVRIDFQSDFETAHFDSSKKFYPRFYGLLRDTLGVEGESDPFQDHFRTGVQICTRYMEEPLKKLDSPVLVVLDEVSRLLDSSFRSDFFGMLRNWHSLRAQKQPFGKLSLLIATSLQPSQLIDDPRMSPFNVGKFLEIKDFSQEEARSLNVIYGTPLTPSQVAHLMEKIGGRPYLWQTALHHVASSTYTFDALMAQAAQEKGPFAQHLTLLSGLLGDKEIRKALVQILKGNKAAGSISSEPLYARLWGEGIVQEAAGRLAFRCSLYKDFFKARLHG